CLLQPSHLAIQRAETTVAVGGEWTHAECVGQREGLPVVGFGLFGLWRRGLRRYFTEEPQGVGFVASFLMGPRELEGALRLSIRLDQPAGAQICLTQPDRPERMVKHEMHRDSLLDRSFQ